MLFRMTAEDEARTLTRVGLVLVLCLAVAGLLIVVKPFGGRPGELTSVVIDTSYVGQGVAGGTAIVIHGVQVGEVTAVSNRPGGGVRLDADLKSGPTTGLTDSLGIDFRPKNYFGVTAINLIPGTGGQALHDGTRIDTVPHGNFTLQTLLSRLEQLTGGVVTPQLIQVLDRATRYTDGLNPLIETLLTTAKAVAKVQTVPTEQLLRNTTGISVAFPSFVNAMAGFGDEFVHIGLVNFDPCPDDYPTCEAGAPVTEEFWQNQYLPSVEFTANGLFSAVGRLEYSHVDDLLPAVDLVKLLTDVVPALIRPEGVAATLTDLRTRLENLYGGSPEQRALQVHIVLDNLPGVAAPLDAMGGP